MKVLIITYYWPPAGGSGVQRWLKFVKYLQEFDIEPVVYTVENPSYPITDVTLSKEVSENIEVIKNSIKEPNQLFSWFSKKSTKESAGFLDSKPTLFGRVLQYIRANFFIPDSRKLWVKPSVKFLNNYLKTHPVDVIISTGPPHSLHLIALQLKEQLGIKWISDFRDPWTEIDYFHQLPLTKSAKLKHTKLEQTVIEQSDAVITVGNYMKRQFSKFNSDIHVITNGYDNEIENKQQPILDAKFSITHIGLMNADRNPFIFWEVIKELCEEDFEFKNDVLIRLVGHIDSEVENSIRLLPKDLIEHIPYVPHEKVKQYQIRTQLLLLAINNVPSAKGIITGKIFEYLQSKRPILAIGPVDGDAAEILNKTNAGVTVGFNDKVSLKNHISQAYKQYKNSRLVVNSNGVEQYHRKHLTEQLAHLIRNTVS